MIINKHKTINHKHKTINDGGNSSKRLREVDGTSSMPRKKVKKGNRLEIK